MRGQQGIRHVSSKFHYRSIQKTSFTLFDGFNGQKKAARQESIYFVPLLLPLFYTASSFHNSFIYCTFNKMSLFSLRFLLHNMYTLLTVSTFQPARRAHAANNWTCLHFGARFARLPADWISLSSGPLNIHHRRSLWEGSQQSPFRMDAFPAPNLAHSNQLFGPISSSILSFLMYARRIT